MKNKVIVISGGSSGIGFALAKRYKEMGNKVLILGSNPKKLAELKDSGFEVLSCNLLDQAAIEKAVTEIYNWTPHIDLLINNAGVQHNYYLRENVIPLSKISEEITINLSGQIILTQLLIPLLSQSKEGHIVNTTSGLAFFPKQDGLVYSASKAGMHNFTIGLRQQLAPYKIAVSEFIPPVTATPMTKGREEAKMSTEELIDRVLPKFIARKKTITIPKIKAFSLIAFFFPALASKIVN